MGKPIVSVSGRLLPLSGDDIDTDRIIPARYLRCVTFDGIEAGVFYDERFSDTGEALDHPFNRTAHKGASILLAGDNFGCGSSREHAPQALYRYGIRAIVAPSFAEIFFSNALTLGMPCVSMEQHRVESLMTLAESAPTFELSLDLEAGVAKVFKLEMPISMPQSARVALLGGRWDPLADLLDAKVAVDLLSAKLPYMTWQP